MRNIIRWFIFFNLRKCRHLGGKNRINLKIIDKNILD